MRTDRIIVQRVNDSRFDVLLIRADGQRVWLAGASSADIANEIAEGEREKFPDAEVRTWDEEAWQALVATAEWVREHFDQAARTRKTPLCEKFYDKNGCKRCPLNSDVFCEHVPRALVKKAPGKLDKISRDYRADMLRALLKAVSEKQREMMRW